MLLLKLIIMQILFILTVSVTGSEKSRKAIASI